MRSASASNKKSPGYPPQAFQSILYPLIFAYGRCFPALQLFRKFKKGCHADVNRLPNIHRKNINHKLKQ
jgi:hypothetical protein